MSSSLVRKSLELLESEPTSKTKPLKKTSKNDPQRLVKNKRKSSQGQISRVLGDVRSEAALQVELARRISSAKEDRTAQNLKNLAALSSSKSVSFKRAEKIFDQTVKNSRPVDDTAPENSSTLFTDEDFRKFEEEYFVS